MRSIASMLVAALGLLAPAAAPATGESEHELSVEIVSRYIWRGYDLSHRDPALLATWTWTPSGASGLWASVGVVAGLRTDTAVGDDARELDEVDLTLGWESSDLARGRLTLGAALNLYEYTSTWTKRVAYRDESDAELNLYLDWRAARHLRPTLEYSRGLDDNVRGDYVEVGCAFPFDGEPWSTEPKIVAGWSDQFGVTEHVTHVTATMPLGWSRNGFTLTPAVSWTWVEDPEEFEPRNLVGGTPRSSWAWGSLRLVWSF